MSGPGRVLSVIGIVLVIAAVIAFLVGDLPLAVPVILIAGYLLRRARQMVVRPLRPGQIK